MKIIEYVGRGHCTTSTLDDDPRYSGGKYSCKNDSAHKVESKDMPIPSTEIGTEGMGLLQKVYYCTVCDKSIN